MTAQLPPASSHAYYPLQRAPPEIWGEIAENLLCSRGKVARKGHIVRFSRTCRAFHELSTPILYRDLRWFAHSSDATDAHDVLVLSDVLQRHPHLYNLVRSMRAFGDGSPSRKSPGIKDMLPVNRFTDLRSLDLRDMRVTPEILQAIVSLPFLRELQLFWCSLAPEAGWPTPDSISTSLREVNLAWPKVSSIPETFFSFFPYLHSLVLSVDSTQTSHILHPLIIHDIPATLTSVTVSLETTDAADMFIFVLQKALRLEIVDLLSSSVDAVVVPSDAVPLLHTYRGPPCLAGSFIKGRGVHTVVFSRLSERSGDLEVHMPILEQSSTTITTLSLHSIKDWSNDLTVLIERCAPGLCILRIYYRSCINGNYPPDARFPKLPCLEKFRLDNTAVGEDESMQQDLVPRWWTMSPTLQEVSFGDSRWTRSARGEWIRHGLMGRIRLPSVRYS